jgi:hypothetical protein
VCRLSLLQHRDQRFLLAALVSLLVELQLLRLHRHLQPRRRVLQLCR